MIELINIVFQLIIFILLFSVGNFSVFSKKNTFELVDTNYEILSKNIIVQLNFILFLSFFNLSLDKIIYSYLIFLIVFLLINLRYFFSYKQILNIKVFFLFFICLVIFFNISFNLTLSWDTEKFWFQKVLNFYNGNSIDNLTNTNRSYNPYLGDLIWAFFWKLSLISEEYSGRLFYGFFYIVSISLLVSNLKTKNIYKFIIILLIIIGTYDYRILFSGNKEILIFSILCLMLHFMNKFFQKNSLNKNNEVLFFILSINLLLWSKQVGFVYLISLLIPLLFLSKLKLNNKLLILISSFIFYFLKLFIYKFYNFDLNLKSCCYNDFTISGILNKITFDRFLLVISYLFFYILQNFIFVIGFIFLALGIRNKKFFFENSYLYLIIFLNLIFVIIIYILTDADLDLMLRTGIERLIFMFLPVFLLVIINYLNHFDKKFLKN